MVVQFVNPDHAFVQNKTVPFNLSFSTREGNYLIKAAIKRGFTSPKPTCCTK